MVVSDSSASVWWGSAHVAEKLSGFYLGIQIQKVQFDSVGRRGCDALELRYFIQEC